MNNEPRLPRARTPEANLTQWERQLKASVEKQGHETSYAPDVHTSNSIEPSTELLESMGGGEG